MCAALKKLGYENIHHMFYVFKTPGEAGKWHALLKIKYEGAGAGTITREMFDDLLGDCSALTDLPSILFARELLILYPDAKVILTTRSTTSWYTSMLHTIYAWQSDPLNRIIDPFLSKHRYALRKLLDYIFLQFFYGNFPLYGKRVFEEHNQMVRDLTEGRGNGERLLVFEAREGWVPLCKFLGKDVPEGEYPRLHDTKEFRSHLIRNGI
ncbi:hypothetical protein IFR04_004883 [Cadophora malorum]|uniref:NAD dependent epimerase/dehydratase n=1 Tax=Cadophora malorum TaxID=108018 RepID=A0A8H7WBZ0_9HELO|nr:hypothetical protein IFR04_004883 [Cadophora malorum]